MEVEETETVLILLCPTWGSPEAPKGRGLILEDATHSMSHRPRVTATPLVHGNLII